MKTTTTGRALIRTAKEEQIDPKFNQIIQSQVKMSRLPPCWQTTDNKQISKRSSWAMNIVTPSRLPDSEMAIESSKCRVLSWALMNVIGNARAPAAGKFKSCHRKAIVEYHLPLLVQTHWIDHILETMKTMNRTMTMGRHLHDHLPFLVLTSEKVSENSLILAL